MRSSRTSGQMTYGDTHLPGQAPLGPESAAGVRVSVENVGYDYALAAAAGRGRVPSGDGERSEASGGGVLRGLRRADRRSTPRFEWGDLRDPAGAHRRRRGPDRLGQVHAGRPRHPTHRSDHRAGAARRSRRDRPGSRCRGPGGCARPATDLRLRRHRARQHHPRFGDPGRGGVGGAADGAGRRFRLCSSSGSRHDGGNAGRRSPAGSANDSPWPGPWCAAPGSSSSTMRRAPSTRRWEPATLAELGAGTGGMTLVVVAYRMSTIALADEVLYLDRGRLVDQGRRRGTHAAPGVCRSRHRLHPRGRRAGRRRGDASRPARPTAGWRIGIPTRRGSGDARDSGDHVDRPGGRSPPDVGDGQTRPRPLPELRTGAVVLFALALLTTGAGGRPRSHPARHRQRPDGDRGPGRRPGLPVSRAGRGGGRGDGVRGIRRQCPTVRGGGGRVGDAAGDRVPGASTICRC